ncbi:GlcG/HbpS family heme-binding protein [Acidocella sp.]|uniref:GlcG/HbpS family heme-binding protein n=1 Tax=Acidocella sp. TaxID=50710 RepID=UPI003CFEA746
MTSAAALSAVRAAVAAGKARGVPVVAAAVDTGGHLLACLRADGAFCASVDIARDKAFTAAVFGASTDDLRAALRHDQVLLDGIAARQNVVLFGGGVPVRENGVVIGGLGVSGGSEDDDRAAAHAGLAALGQPG